MLSRENQQTTTNVYNNQNSTLLDEKPLCENVISSFAVAYIQTMTYILV